MRLIEMTPLLPVRLTEHPGHSSQKVHGRKGAASASTRDDAPHRDDAGLDDALSGFDPIERQYSSEALMAWYGGAYGTIRNAAAGGDASPRAKAYAQEIAGLVVAGKQSPLAYRGIVLTQNQAAQLKVGKTEDMNISSWSENEYVAHSFSHIPGAMAHAPAARTWDPAKGELVSSPEPGVPVIFRAEKGVQGHPIGGDYDEREWISDGRFEVTAISGDRRAGLTVDVTQTAVFAPPELTGLP